MAKGWPSSQTAHANLRWGLGSNRATINRPVVADFCVPQTDRHDMGERPFMTPLQEAKAVAQITGSCSLT